jgi:DNA-binding CsgD family transcriptional regulator
MNSNEILEKTQEFWKNQLKEHTYTDLPDKALKMILSTLVTEFNRTTFCVRKLNSLYHEFVSPNMIDVMGYNDKEFMQKGLPLFIDNLDDEHKSFIPFITEWVQDNYFKIPYENRQNIRFIYCGLRFNHATKSWIRLLVQQSFFEEDKELNPLRICTTKTDISHLMRHNKMWMRISYGEGENKHIETIDYRTRLSQKGDIISHREMDILLLLIEGMDIEAIGKKLFISTNTVKNHRQNMINRLSVKDTTSLIHICRLCGIV